MGRWDGGKKCEQGSPDGDMDMEVQVCQTLAWEIWLIYVSSVEFKAPDRIHIL